MRTYSGDCTKCTNIQIFELYIWRKKNEKGISAEIYYVFLFLHLYDCDCTFPELYVYQSTYEKIWSLCTWAIWATAVIWARFPSRSRSQKYVSRNRGWSPKFATGLNIIIDIVQKVKEWPSCPFAKMISQWAHHFGKRTASSLLYFLNYFYYDI